MPFFAGEALARGRLHDRIAESAQGFGLESLIEPVVVTDQAHFRKIQFPLGIQIFLVNVDRHDFLKTLAEACQKTGWQVHAYCLMSNHYHLVVETPNANLVAGMEPPQSTYTIRLNNRHKLIGHVLSGRYKAQLVEGSSNGYLRTACDYVHLNPVRAGLLKAEERLLSYPWSSFGYYLAAAQQIGRAHV